MKKLFLLVFLVGVGSILVQAQQIKADFTVSDSIICEGDVVVFTNTSTGSINFYNWSFFGGSPSIWIGINPPPPPVVFSIEGTQTVRLTVQDTAFGWDTKQKIILVIPLPDEPEVFVTKCYLATTKASSYQ